MSALDDYRRHKDHVFKHTSDSPLDEAGKLAFTGLRYFPENPALRLTVPVEEFDFKLRVQMPTSTGNQQTFEKWGRFKFEVDGQPAELTLYYTDYGGYFVPFTDATSGHETYGAGRYLEIDENGFGDFVVDFNLAYNPWCAYSPYYSCPIPPADNRLSVPIRAGEMNYSPESSLESSPGSTPES